MNESLENTLIEALALMEEGLGVEEIAARFPERAAELRPFLLTAAALSNLATQPALEAAARSKRAFLAAAGPAGVRPARAAGSGLRRWLGAALALLAVLFLAGAGLAGASGGAMPGDALYGVKRAVEGTRLALASDPERAADLRAQFEAERVREIARLLAAGRTADVSLTGTIEAMALTASGARWTVAGLPVVVSPGTVIDGNPTVGAVAAIDGRTDRGAVEAERVTILVEGLPQPTPQPTTDAQPTAATPTAATPRPTATPETEAEDDNGNENDNEVDGDAPGAPPAASLTPTVPVTPSPTVAPTASASATPGPEPTAVPTDAPTPVPPTTVSPTVPPPSPTATPDDDNDNDDNGNDNGDNGNDNGDNGNDNGDNGNDNGDNGNENDNGDNGNDNSGSGGNNDNGGGDDNENDNDD